MKKQKTNKKRSTTIGQDVMQHMELIIMARAGQKLGMLPAATTAVPGGRRFFFRVTRIGPCMSSSSS
eukprot:3665517-Amphidinium_carterae.1